MRERSLLPGAVWRLAGIFAFLCLLRPAWAEEGLLNHWEERSPDLSDSVREHLKFVLTQLPRIETGRFLRSRVSPQLSFSAKPMAQLGAADSRDVITLEQLRIENEIFPATTERQKRNKACFTAEILAHELLHNAQFRAGLFAFPKNFSGMEAALCERLLEMQAKFFGEKSFFQLAALEDYRSFVSPKPGLFLVMQRNAAEPEKKYEETLWSNRFDTPGEVPLFKDQKREISAWNIAYTEQAFRNHYARFAAGLPGAGDRALRAHLEKILQFTAMPVSAGFLLEHAAIRPVPHGISCWENGQKVLELVATPTGAVRRRFNGKNCQETTIPLAPAR